MSDWMPIAVGILIVAVISGALRRHFVPLRGERRTTKKGAAFEAIATAVLIAMFFLVGLAILGGMVKQ